MKRPNRYFPVLLPAILLLLCVACGAPAEQMPPAAGSLPAAEAVQAVSEAEPVPEIKPGSDPAAEPVREPQTIEEMVRHIGEKYGAVGVQAAVVKGGELYGTYTYGWAKKDQTELTDDHYFTVASISKAVLGIAVQLMREEGYIDLDTDISEYWGVEIKNRHYPDTPITIRNILTHTSSLVSPDADRSRKYEDVRAFLAHEKSFIDKVPGSPDAFVYNNYAFDMLGMTLELASGQYVDDVMQERLYDAMDIQAGYFSDYLDPSLFTPLYSERGFENMTVRTQVGATRGEFPGADGINFCGRLKTNARSLAKLAALLANDGVYNGERLMTAESAAATESFLPSVNGLYGRERVVFHTGDIYGNYTFFSYDPTTGDAVVVLTTGADSHVWDPHGFHAAYGEIAAFAYDHLKNAG